jgi:hypothetical protein
MLLNTPAYALKGAYSARTNELVLNEAAACYNAIGYTPETIRI